MAESFKTFADKRKREVRVTFDQDGTAYYCGVDLAAMSGYAAPAKVVQTSETGSRPAKAVYRKIDCIDKNKRGVRRFRCFDEENALIFLDRRPAPPEVVTWFTNEVVPKVRQISLEMAAKRAKDVQRELELMQEPPRPGGEASSASGGRGLHLGAAGCHHPGMCAAEAGAVSNEITAWRGSQRCGPLFVLSGKGRHDEEF